MTDDLWQSLPRVRRDRLDVPEEVARIALELRGVLLRTHRHLLPVGEHLEECLDEATLELLAGAARGVSYANARHVANVLELRLVARIRDRHRAWGGRSPRQIAAERLLELGDPEAGGVEVADECAEVERIVMGRVLLEQVQEAVTHLSRDQQLALACQVGLQMQRAQFCQQFGWSTEKYNSVIRRAREQLRALVPR